jgi:hypothetical protein
VLPGLLALTTALGGCDGTSRAEDPPNPATPSTTTGTPTGGGQTAAPALDPAHAVDRPGRRTGKAQLADIVVNGSTTIDDDTVRAIRALEGVQDVEVISLVQVVIENRSINLAAVDPATYRNYTPYGSAVTQDIWDRVADGELAMRPALAKRVPQDRDGFLSLGSAESAVDVHIGALAAQAAQVDAVVNRTWIPTLDMTPDNALLIRTGSTAPLSQRKPIERILGGRSSVQMVDAVARSGIDPDVVQTAVVVGSVADAVGTFRYTVLGGGRIAPDPAWVSSHIVTATVPILGQVTCNRLLFPQLVAALQDIQDRGLADEIHPGEYAGCYYPRFIAGTTTLSNHSFGLALDLNVPGNQRGSVGEIDRGVVAIFKHWGFTWGGDWSYTDPMHFEMNTVVQPR